MKQSRLTVARILALCIAAAALVLGYSAVSTAMDFGPVQGLMTPAPAPAAPAAPAAPPADPAPVVVDEARVLAGLAVYKEAGCRGCHGWASNGVREGPNPEGPSLRASTLPMDLIHLTVACGRPGTPMPYFWRDAYRRDSIECYGQTGAQLGALQPTRAGVRFTTQEIDDLTYYLEYYVKGLGEITFEECEFYFGVANAQCNFYRP